MAKLLNKHVAESTIQPDRLIRSQGQVHYNYNVTESKRTEKANE
jgi:hypothetical protein